MLGERRGKLHLRVSYVDSKELFESAHRLHSISRLRLFAIASPKDAFAAREPIVGFVDFLLLRIERFLFRFKNLLDMKMSCNEVIWQRNWLTVILPQLKPFNRPPNLPHEWFCSKKTHISTLQYRIVGVELTPKREPTFGNNLPGDIFTNRGRERSKPLPNCS